MIEVMITDKHGIQLEEYNGNFSIQPFYIDYKGNQSLNWVRTFYYDKDQGKQVMSEKNTPLKIKIGDKEKTIEVLKALLNQLGYEIHQGESVDKFPDDQIPF